MMRNAPAAAGLSLLLAVQLVLAGCGNVAPPGGAATSTNAAPPATPATPVAQAGPESPDAAPVVSPFPAAEPIEVVLFFPRRDGPGLVRETRMVARRGEQPEMLVLAEFLRGPTAAGARPAFPPADPRDYGVKVFDGRAAVWLPPQSLKDAADRQDAWAVRALVETLCHGGRVNEVQVVTGAAGPKRIGEIDLGQPLKPAGPPEPARNLPAGPAPDGFHPPDARTGSPEIDRVIDAVLKRDPGTLTGLARLTKTGGPGGAGAAVFPTFQCDPVFLASIQEVRRFFESTLARQLYLYAVYRPNRKIGEGVPAYALTFAANLEDNYGPTLYLAEDGAVVGLRQGCGLPGTSVPKEASLILAPPGGRTDRSQAEANLLQLIQDESATMLHWLRVVTGEDVPCGTPCVRDTSLAGIDGLISRCARVAAGALRHADAFDPVRHGPALDAYEQACHTLTSARETLGEPRDSPEWRQKAIEARTVLANAGRR